MNSTTTTVAGRGRWACLGGGVLLALGTAAVLLATPTTPTTGPVPAPSPGTAPVAEGDAGGRDGGGDR